jgi:hypothetical protein
VVISNGVINLNLSADKAARGEAANFHPARTWLDERAELGQRTV